MSDDLFLGYVHVPQDRDAQRAQKVVLDVRLDEPLLDTTVPQEDPGSIPEYGLLGLPVEFVPESLVAFRSCLHQQSIDIGVAVPGVVGLAFAVEEDVQEVLRVGVVRDPAYSAEHMEAAPLHVSKIGGQVRKLYFDLDTEVLEPHLKNGLQRGAQPAPSRSGNGEHDG